MTLADRLRQLAAALPPGGSVVLDRDALEALADEAAGSAAGGHSGDLTAEEAAVALGCSSASVRRACEAGRLRAFKLGSGARASWRIPANALAAFRTAAPRPGRGNPRTAGRYGRVAARGPQGERGNVNHGRREDVPEIDEHQLRAMAARVAGGESVRRVAREHGIAEATLRRKLHALQAGPEPAAAPAAPPTPTPAVPLIPHGQAASVWPPPAYLAQLRADFDAGRLRGGPYESQARRDA